MLHNIRYQYFFCLSTKCTIIRTDLVRIILIEWTHNVKHIYFVLHTHVGHQSKLECVRPISNNAKLPVGNVCETNFLESGQITGNYASWLTVQKCIELKNVNAMCDNEHQNSH